MTALEDWSVTDKQEWDAATKFLETTLQMQLSEGEMSAGRKSGVVASCEPLKRKSFKVLVT